MQPTQGELSLPSGTHINTSTLSDQEGTLSILEPKTYRNTALNLPSSF